MSSALLSVFMMNGLLLAQSFTGAITGTVSDSSGANIPGVLVTASSRDTGQKRSAQANGVGEYSIQALPPGTYKMDVELSGFKHWERTNVRVDVLQGVTIDVVLEPGSVTDTVIVTAESPLLETSNAAVGAVVDNKKIIDLPMNGRNAMALVALTPGVVPAGADNFGGQPVLQNVYAQGNFTINSGVQNQSESLVDGVPNNVFLWNAPAFVPSVDAIAEFRVQTNNFSAEFGHSGGGIINLTTRSGSNEFRGTAFEFFRNGQLDANNFFNNRAGQPRPAFTYNQYGISVGGPVLLPRYNGRNRTFFFANYEGFRQRAGRTVLATVPSTLERSGDFSQTRNAAGQPVTIYDPYMVRATPGAGSGYQRDPFPGNRIPASRFDPAAAANVKLWPLPNLPGTGPAMISNFISNPILRNVQDQWTTRVDHAWSAAQRTFGRFSFMRQLPGQADAFATAPGARPVNPFEFSTALLIRSYSAAVDHTWIASPATLFGFRYGLSRQKQFRDPASLGIDLTSIGFAADYNNAVQIRTRPSLAPSGYDAVGEGGNIYFRRGDNAHSAQASMTHSAGGKTIKAGFEFRGFLFNDTRAPAASGAFGFNQGFTQADPLRATATAGNSYASYLLGLAASGSVQYFPAVSLNQKYYGLYVQDDVRVTRTLVVNVGLRWDVETPRTERYNRLSTFDTGAVSPLAQLSGLNLHGGLRFAGVDGRGRGAWATEWKNFAPRFGFAWRGRPKMVIRGGYGIFYHQTVGQGGLVGNGNDGFAATTAMVTSPDGGITPGARLHDPYPEGLSLPTGSSLALNSRVGESLQQWDPNFPNAYSQHFNFGIQYELPGAVIAELAYVGSHSIGLPLVAPLNQMRPQYLALGGALLNQVRNPFFGVVSTGVLRTPTVAANRLLRPFPQFDNISFFTPIGQATYNSLQARFEKRFSGGFGVQIAYTFAKALTDLGGGAGSGIGGFNTPTIQNYYDLGSEKAVSPVDVTHRLVSSFQYELPFGRAKRWDPKSAALNVAIGGWQINGIATMQSGLPLGVTTSVNQINAFTGASRPNVSGYAGLPSSERTLNHWFNTAVFSQPAAFQFGNAPRTFGNVRGPAFQNFDLSLFKNTAFREKYTLQLRFEGFNVLNRANFNSPGAVFGTAQFGLISTTGPARVLQIGAKLYF